MYFVNWFEFLIVDVESEFTMPTILVSTFCFHWLIFRLGDMPVIWTFG